MSELDRLRDLRSELRRYFVEGHPPAPLNRATDLYLLLCECERIADQPTVVDGNIAADLRDYGQAFYRVSPDGTKTHIPLTDVAADKSLDVPYPQFCRHPDKCAGKGSCPRDPCCAE
jgi:hypothetical protein